MALEALCRAGHSPALVATLPLERSASHSDFADLGPIAERNRIAVERIACSDAPEFLALLRDMAPDLVMIIGWSQLVGSELLSLPRLGVLGFHPSPLPRMRGRAVIPWQILTGQRQGGATLFWITEGMDDGPIAAQRVFDIDPDTVTARELYDRSVSEMTRMLPDLLDALRDGQRPASPQDEARATICARRRPEDGRIDWSGSAGEIERLIRAVGPPYPGAWTTDAKGEAAVILSARLSRREGYFVGLPGQVQEVGESHVTVMCGDGRCLDILEWDGDASLTRHAMLGAG